MISIHTSAREVTFVLPFFVLLLANFNPHFRKGSDGHIDINYKNLSISIHTSAREVTSSASISSSSFHISIHTSAREVTRLFSVFYCLFSISIHTSAREVTNRGLTCFSTLLFQSTLPQGKWLCRLFSCTGHGQISIHTSAREVTKFLMFLQVFAHISIHTSAREVTRRSCIIMR